MSERLDRFYYYREAETGLTKIRQLAGALEALGTMNENQATETAQRFLEATTIVADQHPAVHEVQLMASGYDVLVPKLSATSGDDGVQLNIDPEAPYQRVGNLMGVEGKFAQMGVGHLKQEDAEGVQLRGNMFLAHKDSSLSVPFQQMPFWHIEITRLISVPLANDADVQVGIKELELLRERQQAFVTLGKNGLARSRYAKRLHALDAAMADEDDGEYIDLQNIKILHDIGRLGKRYVDALPHLDDAVTDPLIKTLGVGRYVNVETDAIMQIDSSGELTSTSGAIKGRIIGVCSQVRGYSSDSLMLALAGNNTHDVSYVPLCKIERFLF